LKNELENKKPASRKTAKQANSQPIKKRGCKNKLRLEDKTATDEEGKTLHIVYGEVFADSERAM
jgi:hypothetical protein